MKADTRLTPFLPLSRRNPVSGGENIGIKQQCLNIYLYIILYVFIYGVESITTLNKM